MLQPQRNEALSFHAHPVLQAAQFFRTGGLVVTLPAGTQLFYSGLEAGTRADLRINDKRALDQVISHGDIGFGEGYMQGLWDTSDLKSLLQLLGENMDSVEGYLAGTRFFRMFYALKNKLRSNTDIGSRKNIEAHYDIGNDFYRLWLDDTMTYSGGLFGGDAQKTLEEAQRAKYRRIMGRLSPARTDHILDIGCGWGGFATQAAQAGCQVTGITISPSQVEFARTRLAQAGLDDRVEIRLQDYRELQEQFDHVVSIGMFEHVGENYWAEYMQTIRSALKPSGKAMMQSIVIRDDLFDGYRNTSDFIREHIFPGGMLPTTKRFVAEAERAGLRVNDVFLFGSDYALTLEKWLERFDQNILHISSLGYSEEFIRKWRFYLAACAAMFRIGRMNVIQVELSRA